MNYPTMSSFQINPKFQSSDSFYVPVTWFPIGQKTLVKNTCRELRGQGMKMVRVGVDYSKVFSKNQMNWYKWLMSLLAQEFEVEPCFIKSQTSNSDHRNKLTVAEAIEAFVHSCGETFSSVGIWHSGQRILSKDNSENIYEQDIVFAICWTKHLGKKVSLCGINPSDFDWIASMISYQVFKNITIITVEPEISMYHRDKFFPKMLHRFLEAKGFNIAIRSSLWSSSDDKSVNRILSKPKNALLDPPLKITG